MINVNSFLCFINNNLLSLSSNEENMCKHNNYSFDFSQVPIPDQNDSKNSISKYYTWLEEVFQEWLIDEKSEMENRLINMIK